MIQRYLSNWHNAWNEFWFRPRASSILAIMRILVGSMLLYTHAIWTLELVTFFGFENSAIPYDYRSLFPHVGAFSWSHFDWVDSPAWLWGTHLFALCVFLCFMIGFMTRATGVLACLFAISYANRASGALFGLDQINVFLTLYLALSHCGSIYSVDARLKRNKTTDRDPDSSEGWQGRGVVSVANTIATRLIQVHICIVYLFAGLGKAQGTSWWNGEAVWGTLASYEYQTLELTWMHEFMWLINLLTFLTVAWEISYAFLIWHKLTRPLFLLMAVFVHLGIGLAMGMFTFGLIMLYANLAFIEPQWVVNPLGNPSGDSLPD